MHTNHSPQPYRGKKGEEEGEEEGNSVFAVVNSLYTLMRHVLSLYSLHRQRGYTQVYSAPRGEPTAGRLPWTERSRTVGEVISYLPAHYHSIPGTTCSL